jgi:hypothetical protein
LITDVRNPNVRSILTQSDLLRFAYENTDLLGELDVNATIESLGFRCAHPSLITVKTTDKVMQAFQTMAKSKCHAFPVLDEYVSRPLCTLRVSNIEAVLVVRADWWRI